MQTQFGSVDLRDRKSLQDFLARHNQAHMDLAQNLSRTGVHLQVPPLAGPLTDDWLEAHATLHRAINTALGVPGSVGLHASIVLLKQPSAFYEWLLLNDLDHQQYLRASDGG